MGYARGVGDLFSCTLSPEQSCCSALQMAVTSVEVIPVIGLWAVNTHLERSRHLGKVQPHRKNRDRTKKNSLKEKCMVVQFLRYWNKCEKAGKPTVEAV